MTVNIILDVDTGVDDAFAILYATRNPEIKVLGITCVDGNTNLEQVCKNTLQVLDMAGAHNIPVAAGAAAPLMGQLKTLAMLPTSTAETGLPAFPNLTAQDL